MQPTPVFLPGESPWTKEPGGLQSWGHKELDTTKKLSTVQQLQCRETNRGLQVTGETETGAAGDLFC